MSLVVDADGHILEPRNTWLDYVEPRFRDRAIRIERDEKDEEVLLVDGKSLEVVRGRLAALGGIEMDPSEALATGKYKYEVGCPKGSYDPAARLEVTAEVVRHVGADYFIWASDYPHIDASMGVVKEIRERIAPLPEESQRLVLGENAVRFYGL